MKYCEKLSKELINTEHFHLDNTGLYINFKECDYDSDYGYAVFTHLVKINYCPFCGEKVR